MCVCVCVRAHARAQELFGDSGFMVVRDGCTIFRSPVQQHDFNFTYQLECGSNGDLPSSGQVFSFCGIHPLENLIKLAIEASFIHS